MFMILINLIISLTISMIVMKLSIMLSKKMNFNYEKLTPFECGFDPINSSRLPFSIRFFLITIIFLIFDIEIALLLPMIKSFFISNLMNWLLTSNLIMLILILGLYMEWNNGALNWTN